MVYDFTHIRTRQQESAILESRLLLDIVVDQEENQELNYEPL